MARDGSVRNASRVVWSELRHESLGPPSGCRIGAAQVGQNSCQFVQDGAQQWATHWDRSPSPELALSRCEQVAPRPISELRKDPGVLC